MGMEYGFMGPNYSISTACATANYCFVTAANHIRRGDADVILAGGSEAPIIAIGLGGFVACRWAAASNQARQGVCLERFICIPINHLHGHLLARSTYAGCLRQAQVA